MSCAAQQSADAAAVEVLDLITLVRGGSWHQVCQQEGFTENAAKRRVLRRSNQQRITGVVVNAGLSIPRAARREFRAILHNCRRHGVAAQARGRKDFRSYLLGFASYVKMVQPALGRELLAEVREILRAERGKDAAES